MSKKPAGELLAEVNAFSRTRKLSKKEMSQRLNIPYSTFKKWFFKGNTKKNPSPVYIEKLERFIKSEKETAIYWKDLWMKILRWWETQHRYSTVRELADEISWDVQNLDNYLQNEEMPPKPVVEKIAETAGFEIPDLDSMLKEAKRKTEKIEHLLLLLEKELRWFRDGPKEARDIFRKELAPGDVGYISSLISMLGEEDKFKRWLILTTNRFNSFKKRRKQK